MEITPSLRRRLAWASWTIAGPAMGACVALVRWSSWWPHRDVRQLWGSIGVVVFGALGLVGLITSLVLTQGRVRRWLAIVAIGAVASIVALVAYDRLVAMTEPAR